MVNDGTPNSAISKQSCDGGCICGSRQRTELRRVEDAEVDAFEFFRIEVRGQTFLIEFKGGTTFGGNPRGFLARSKELFEDVCRKTNAVQIRCGCGHGR